MADANSLSDVRFLIVDDHAFVRRVVAELLKGLGVTTVDAAADGAEALTLLAGMIGTSARLCVVTDFEMPNVNGLALLKAIRTGAARIPAATPVLILTGLSNDEASKPAMQLDVSGFVEKPVSRAVLSAAIQRALAQSPALKAPEVYEAVSVT